MKRTVQPLDRHGYPVERIKGRPLLSLLRILIHTRRVGWWPVKGVIPIPRDPGKATSGYAYSRRLQRAEAEAERLRVTASDLADIIYEERRRGTAHGGRPEIRAADRILALLRPAADEGAGRREELLERIDLFLGGEWDTSYEASAALLREARTLLDTPAACGCRSDYAGHQYEWCSEHATPTAPKGAGSE